MRILVGDEPWLKRYLVRNQDQVRARLPQSSHSGQMIVSGFLVRRSSFELLAIRTSQPRPGYSTEVTSVLVARYVERGEIKRSVVPCDTAVVAHALLAAERKLFRERFFIHDSGQEWIVDQYHHVHDGLMLAYPVGDHDSEILHAVPAWCGRDVSGDASFDLYSLASEYIDGSEIGRFSS